MVKGYSYFFEEWVFPFVLKSLFSFKIGFASIMVLNNSFFSFWNEILDSYHSIFRFYYRCTYKNEIKCAATKQVQQKDSTSGPPLFSVTYFNHHTCVTSSNPMGSTRNGTAQSSLKKAVSLCFSSHNNSSIEQPTFLTSSATPASPSIQSYRANHQQPDRSAYARQFQWTGTAHPTSNGAAKMEVDKFSEASASSSSTGARSRTLLPISQSRCIEYFHFLWIVIVFRGAEAYILWSRQAHVSSAKWSLYVELEAIYIAVPGLQHREPTDRSPYGHYHHPCSFAFGLKPHFCAWIMWKMTIQFLYLIQYMIQKGFLSPGRAICLFRDYLTGMSEVLTAVFWDYWNTECCRTVYSNFYFVWRSAFYKTIGLSITMKPWVDWSSTK
jgi:hypothetical protein